MLLQKGHVSTTNSLSLIEVILKLRLPAVDSNIYLTKVANRANFIPDPEPTLRTGVYALTSAALAYLPATGYVKKTA